jgi:hypothetical protein
MANTSIGRSGDVVQHRPFYHYHPHRIEGFPALLATVTVLVWWLTWPHQRDVFWDIEEVSPAENKATVSQAR